MKKVFFLISSMLTLVDLSSRHGDRYEPFLYGKGRPTRTANYTSKATKHGAVPVAACGKGGRSCTEYSFGEIPLALFILACVCLVLTSTPWHGLCSAAVLARCAMTVPHSARRAVP